MSAPTSSGRPGRPTGVNVPATRSCGVALPVAIQPGATELTVTPDALTSIASARVSPSIPALAALYADDPGKLTSGPVTEETLTTRPWPRATMSGSAARHTLAAVVRLRSIVACQACGESSRNGRSGSASPACTIPALLTRMSSGPSADCASATARTAASGSVRSATTAADVTPARVRSAARSALRGVVAPTATAAPSAPSRRAAAKPMPSGAPAPVTSATRPARSNGRRPGGSAGPVIAG